jgi:hypoxanthine-DNA glycosylase
MIDVSVGHINGFSPIVSGQVNVLILGTMPSEASLMANQYYGHPRNAFWPIMCALFGETSTNYNLRVELLIKHNIAVWDVLQSCSRLGSLDTNIRPETIIVNNFVDFFTEYKEIKQVFFNGKVAEKLYQKRVWPYLMPYFPYLEYHCLPSTSPAYAALSFNQKVDAWKVIKQSVVK